MLQYNKFNMVTVGLILLGLTAGALSGLIGIGGGVLIVPALIFIFGLSQKVAQGTTLALLIPPIGITAAYMYYKQGYVDLRIASLIIIGFIVGGWIGAKIAINVPTDVLSKIFGIIIIIIGIKMLFGK